MNPAKIAAGLFLAAAIFIAGFLSNRRPDASSASVRQPLHYACPMHPEYKSARVGACPSCGMRLEPVYAGTARAVPSGMVEVGAAQQQLIGVRTEAVERGSGSNLVRVSGRIAPDDSRVYRLVAATDGWVRELGRNPPGALVKPNEALASYFVRDLISAQQNYLYAYQTNAQVGQQNVVPQRNSAALNLRLALDALRSLGMTDTEIEELQAKGQPSAEMHLYSPAAGLVLARNISPGQRFDKGSELYRIADISHVWLVADVFERDREFLSPGATAVARYRGREFRARMSDLLPQFDPQSRTMKTRFELDNPGDLLRPDMFLDVEIRVNMPPGITVPSDAVIDSGRHKTVYVDRGDNLFEPRLVKTGSRLGDRVQVTEGLAPGERIVVSGNFLIDSESRLRLAAAGVPTAPDRVAGKDPVCGMQLDPAAPGSVQGQYRGKSYVFCSPACKKNFDAAPTKYVPGERATADGQGMRGMP
jgi:multidrug efflux pump subunit AcrA (membrane-fusion protein)/YHS domain-containing protein